MRNHSFESEIVFFTKSDFHSSRTGRLWSLESLFVRVKFHSKKSEFSLFYIKRVNLHRGPRTHITGIFIKLKLPLAQCKLIMVLKESAGVCCHA